MNANSKPALHGLMAEYNDTDAIVEAAERAYDAGYRKIEAYSPFPVEGLAEAIGFQRNAIAPLVLIAGILGAFTAFSFMYYTAVYYYPLNISGKPLFSWPSFIPITFELTVLFSASTAVFGMIILNGLPRPYNPVFNAPGFELASQDRFFLCIEATDPKFQLEETKRFLEGLNPTSVVEVEP